MKQIDMSSLDNLTNLDIDRIQTEPLQVEISLSAYEAKTFLDKYSNPLNRPISQKTYSEWAKTFENGEYDKHHPNRIGIVLVWIRSLNTWRLANGHTRLGGFSKSKAPTEEIVLELRCVNDLDGFRSMASKFDIQDGGKPRNVYQSLVMDGWLQDVHPDIASKIKSLTIQSMSGYNHAHTDKTFTFQKALEYVQRYEKELVVLSDIYKSVKCVIGIDQTIVNWFFSSGKSEDSKTAPAALKLQVLVDLLAIKPYGEEFVRNLFRVNSSLSYVTALFQHIQAESKRLSYRMTELQKAGISLGVGTHNKHNYVNRFTLMYLSSYWNRFIAGDTKIKDVQILDYSKPLQFSLMAEDRVALPHTKVEQEEEIQSQDVQPDGLAVLCATM